MDAATLLRKITLPATALAGIVLLPLGALTLGQHRLIYHPHQNPPGMTDSFLLSGGMRVVSYTSQGRQIAWLRHAKSYPPKTPWLVCAGNGTLALELDHFMRQNVPSDDAILYFDHPGYGESEGAPSPARIQESLQELLPDVANRCEIPEAEIPTRVAVFGHSLGAAVALMAADTFKLRRVVLLAPFTSTMDMAEIVTGLPLGLLVTHRFDNLSRVESLACNGARIRIIHGEEDEVIPVTMGRKLAAKAGKPGSFIEVPGGRHNDLFQVAEPSIRAAIREPLP